MTSSGVVRGERPGVGGLAEPPGGLREPPDRPVEPARGQGPVGDGHVGVGGPRVLGEMADGAGTRDGAGGRGAQPGQGVEEGGLAGAAAADQADPVAGGDVE